MVLNMPTFFEVQCHHARSVISETVTWKVYKVGTKIEAKARFKKENPEIGSIVSLGAKRVRGIECPTCRACFILPPQVQRTSYLVNWGGNPKRCLVMCEFCKILIVYKKPRPRTCSRCRLKVECLLFPIAIEGVHF